MTTTAFEFACPSCAAPGKARVDWAGRSVRCKHCKSVFVLPSPGEAMADSYDLAEPVPRPESGPSPAAVRPAAERAVASTFTPSYREGSLEHVPIDRARPAQRRPVDPREELHRWGGDLRVRVLLGLALAAALLTLATFTIPGFGPTGAAALVFSGTALVAIGYFVGAYAAFCEDWLYGMGYLFFPLYTGYYLVTRFDDLWPFFSVSTLGFVMVLIGTNALF